jgi:tetratricopeptide (TPR) repeat protein
MSAISLAGCLEDMSGEQQTAAAWDALTRKDYKEAIKRADACIDEFRIEARRRQRELDEQRVHIPSGRVNGKCKEAIVKNGPLNDVATCYYIKGRAADKLGLKAEAADALREAQKYPAGRGWDQRGWFWTPAEAAQVYVKNPELADKAPHEIYVADAWTAFNANDHAKAIEHADKCIDEFQSAATELETALSKRNEQFPTGAVDDAAKKRMFEYGPLNDVATCLYIKGQSAEATGDKKTAAKVYRILVKLTYGRCWDPKGWFWSPADAAAERLEQLRTDENVKKP